jgi:hypothetical protein
VIVDLSTPPVLRPATARCFLRAVSDAAGLFAIPGVPRGLPLVLAATHPNFVAERVARETTRGEPQPVVIRLGLGGRIEGRVVDAEAGSTARPCGSAHRRARGRCGTGSSGGGVRHDRERRGVLRRADRVGGEDVVHRISGPRSAESGGRSRRSRSGRSRRRRRFGRGCALRRCRRKRRRLAGLRRSCAKRGDSVAAAKAPSSRTSATDASSSPLCDPAPMRSS